MGMSLFTLILLVHGNAGWQRRLVVHGNGMAEATARAEGRARLRVLLLSYEFTHAPFSGNGVLARSLVKGLLGNECDVLAVCCRPSPSCDCLSVDKPIAPPEVSLSEAAALRTLAVDLPASCGWRRLGRGSGWQVYSDEAARLVQKGAPVYVFAPSVVLAIDWSGCAAWRAMRAAWPSENPEDAPELGRAQPCTQPIPRMLYINFRVYSSGLLPDEADVSWYDEQETVALGLAERAFALSTRDQVTLNALIPSKSELRRGPGVGVLLPCLRGDMQVLAETPEIVHRVHLPPPALEAVAATEAAARASMEIPPGMQLATTARPMREGRCCVRCTPLQGEESSTLLSPDRDDS